MIESIRQGTGFGPMAKPDLPMIPGPEVDQVGTGADPSWLGRRVVVHLGFTSGGYATQAVADAAAVFPVPDHVTAAAAVAMVGTGRTALGVIETADPRADDVVLVTAAASGLGSLLVQAARNAGAIVAGVAGGRDKVKVIEQLGADVAVDYATDDWADHVRKDLAGRDVTLALDGVGGDIGRAAFELVRPGGRMVMFGYASGSATALSAEDLFSSGVTVTAAVGPRMLSRPGGIQGLAEQALDELAAGRLTPVIQPPLRAVRRRRCPSGHRNPSYHWQGHPRTLSHNPPSPGMKRVRGSLQYLHTQTLLEATMPAISVDPTTVPKLPEPDAGAIERPVKSITTAPSGFEGEGFPVRRAFAGVPVADLDPFVHMDQMGEVDYAPGEPRGTDWHPHRGFETVTYIIDGTFLHEDSHGGGGSITNGATQWMTAGGGILHIETPPEQLVVSGGLFHGLQLWVNLPSAKKMVEPRYQNLDADLVTVLASGDGGSLVRLIAGDLGGHEGPGSTHTPIIVTHITIAPGSRLHVPWPSDHNALAYALSGHGTVGASHNGDAAAIQQGQLTVFGEGDALTITGPESGETPLDIYLIGGKPLREPVAHYGPFVMNTRAELQEAMNDYQSGRLGTIPADGLRPYRPSRER